MRTLKVIGKLGDYPASSVAAVDAHLRRLRDMLAVKPGLEARIRRDVDDLLDARAELMISERESVAA